MLVIVFPQEMMIFVFNNIQKIANFNDIIQRAFWMPGYHLRKELIKLMEKAGVHDNGDKFHEMYKSLRDPTCYIRGEEWSDRMAALFKSSSNCGYQKLICDLANKSCQIQPDTTLSDEIEQFGNRQKNEILQKIAAKNEAIAEILPQLNVDNYEQISTLLKELNKQRKMLLNKLKGSGLPALDDERLEGKIQLIERRK